MTCFLKSVLSWRNPAVHVIPTWASGQRHGIYARRLKKQRFIAGSRKHRSQATAPSSVGMTCFLKPALTIYKSQPSRSKPSSPCHSCRGTCGRWESMGNGTKGKNLLCRPQRLFFCFFISKYQILLYFCTQSTINNQQFNNQQFNNNTNGRTDLHPEATDYRGFEP